MIFFAALSLASSLFCPITALPTPDNAVISIVSLTPDEGWYTIQNTYTGSFLDLHGGGIDVGTPINGYHYNGHSNQMWYLAKQYGAGRQTFRISTAADSTNSTFAVFSDSTNSLAASKDNSYGWRVTGDSPNGPWTFTSTTVSQPIGLWTKGDDQTVKRSTAGANGPLAQQEWILTRVKPVDYGYYNIRSLAFPDNGLSGGAVGQDSVTSEPLKPTSGDQLLWLLSPASQWGGYYIQNAYNNQYLAPGANSTSLHLNSTAGTWTLQVTSPMGAKQTTYSLVAANGQVADIRGGASNPGAQVISWDSHMGTNQMWTLEWSSANGVISGGFMQMARPY